MSGSGPQKENGFTAIANEIMERLASAPLRGQQFRCLMFLFRKTYGYNKKEDTLSLAEWESGTGMKRQNVWRELETLIKCNVIYKKSSGPKRPNTWGFNKHYEHWNFDSVIVDDDKSVITDDYKETQPVIVDDDKSVITPHEHTKDNKAKQLAARVIEDESGDSATALVLLAYQAVCGLAPSMQSEKGRANILTAFELIDTYSYANCVRGLSTLKERQDAMFKKNGRDRIKAPLGYLRTILAEDYAAPSVISAPATVNFALEELV